MSNDFTAFCERHAGLLEQVRQLLFNLEQRLSQDSKRREAILDLRIRIDREIEKLRIAA